MDIYEKMEIHLRLARYRERTVQTYVRNIRIAIKQIDRAPESFTESDILKFLNGLFDSGASGPTIISYFSSLKYLIVKVLKLKWPVEKIERFGKFGANKPRPLSRTEITSLLAATPDIKYRAMFVLAYSSGLRVSEICQLKLSDLNFHAKLVYVRNGKGGVSRQTTLSQKAIELIHRYLSAHYVSNWLFASGRKDCKSGMLFPVPSSDKPISVRSVERTFRITADKLKFPGFTTLHSLRHSFGTHLIEDGMSIFCIQRMMGHQHIRTTLKYLYTAETPPQKFFSPFDNF